MKPQLFVVLSIIFAASLSVAHAEVIIPDSRESYEALTEECEDRVAGESSRTQVAEREERVVEKKIASRPHYPGSRRSSSLEVRRGRDQLRHEYNLLRENNRQERYRDESDREWVDMRFSHSIEDRRMTERERDGGVRRQIALSRDQRSWYREQNRATERARRQRQREINDGFDNLSQVLRDGIRVSREVRRYR